MDRLGQYLVERNLISEDQLNEALQCQAVFGGRLGTNLVELGYLSLEDLARLLGVRAGLPVAPVEWLESPQPDALEAIPRELCEQLKLLPMRVEDGAIHVAMMDATNAGQIDSIQEQTQLDIKPYVVPELRMYVWLERHMGVRRQIRFARLGRQYSRGSSPGTLVGDPTGPDPRAERLRELGMQPLAVGEELTQEGDEMQGVEIVVEEPQLPELDIRELIVDEEQDTDVLMPPANPSETVELERKLEQAASRDDVAENALRLARGHVAVAALFVVNKGMLQGFRGAGGRLERQDIGGILLPTAADSCLREPATSGVPQRVRGVSGDINQRLLRALARENPLEVGGFPVRIRGRIINVLYVDNGDDPISSTAFAALQALCERIGAGYENVILLNKQSAQKSSEAGSS